MTQGDGGTMLEEPPHESRRERREKARPSRRSARPAPTPEPEPESPGLSPRQARRLRDRRRRFWFILMPVVAVLLALSVAIGMAIRSDSDSSSSGPSSSGPAPTARSMHTVLVAHRGADDRIDLLLLAGATQKAASVLLFPVATQVEVPSLGPTELADLPTDGDQGLLATTVENLLGVKVDTTVVLDDAGLNAALAPAAPLTVALGQDVEFAGSDEAPIPQGSEQMPTGAVSRVLVARQTGSELDRLVTVQDVLDAWMDRLRTPSIAKRTVAVQPELAGVVSAAAVAPADRRVDTLPVESVTTGGTERFEPRGADIKQYAAAAFPDALLGVGKRRPRVEILNGTGAVGLAQTIASRVVPAGGQVTLTGNVANFGLTETQIVYYRPADRTAAQRLLRAVGCGALKKADTAIGVVDVTILAGADCFRTGAVPAP